MHPVIFQTDLFGLLDEPLKLHTYGMLIATGFIVAMLLSSRQAEREGESADAIVDLAFYALVAGLVGARAAFIITKFDYYLANPLEVLMFWRGGVVFYGGFIGAAVMVWWYCKRRRLPFFKVVDVLVPYLALAHTFGRLGCLAAGCCYGKPTDLPWGTVFPAGSMAQQAHQAAGLVGISEPALPIHPTQLYEAGAELALFWVLLWLRPHKRFHGQLFLTWLAAYPVIRSGIEVFRGDVERGIYWGLSFAQWISIGVAAAAVWLYVYLRRQRTRHSAADWGSAACGEA